MFSLPEIRLRSHKPPVWHLKQRLMTRKHSSVCRRPVYPDAVQTGVIWLSPVGRHLDFHELEGSVTDLLQEQLLSSLCSLVNVTSSLENETTHADGEGLDGVSVLVVGVGTQQLASLLVLIVQTLEARSPSVSNRKQAASLCCVSSHSRKR